MILHIVFDDKFVDYAISQFENQSITSRFVLISDETTIRYIRRIDKICIIKYNTNEFTDFLNNLSQYSGILFHGLFNPYQEIVLRSAPATTKIAWMFWGAEIYGRKGLVPKFLFPKSKLLYYLHELYAFAKNKFIPLDYYFIPKESFNRVDYCLTFLDWEYRFAKNYLKNNMSLIWYNYYSIEETIGPLMNSYSHGTNVLLGNSCSIENNHLDILLKLKHKLPSSSKILMPLSYGEPWLKNLLVKVGTRIYGERFIPLLNFIPLQEYNSRMLECGAMVMNHIRPQAQGNILTGLWLGMRVYLSKKNMTYSYFKQNGLKIFSIEDDLTQDAINFTPLSIEETQHNRALLLKISGVERMKKAVNEVIEKLS